MTSTSPSTPSTPANLAAAAGIAQDFIAQKIGIAIVAPGGHAPDEAGVARGIASLEAQGCLVHNYYDPALKYQRFGGTDAARIAQLMAATSDPEIQIVMALRGSYGISRILPALDFDHFAASGKLYVGYSDFTAFHMGLLASRGGAGGISFAGPMLCDDFTREDADPFTLQNFWQCLRGPDHIVHAQQVGNPQVAVSGTLWGGNLSMLTHLLATPHFPQINGGILFIEDVNEHPYRVERMLLQLLHAGVLGRQQALVLGDFSAYRLGAFENGYNFDEMLAYIRATLPLPVFTGLRFGHTRERVTLPVGAPAELVSDASGFRLHISGYPTL
jgi:muramoyltetrapeptide carboxypeptidase